MQTATKNRIDVPPVVNGEPNIVEMANGQQQERSVAPIANLAAALAAAQKKCQAVVQDKKNTFHGYRYASAEAIITEAREALSDTGLSLLPLRQSIDGGGTDRYELQRTFLLLHTSGERMPLYVAWPVVPEKGRPLDKAAAIADTLSLSYLLRDLLLMPRIDEKDDANARDDRQAEPAQPREPEPAPEQPTKPAAKRPSEADLVMKRDRLLVQLGVDMATEAGRQKWTNSLTAKFNGKEAWEQLTPAQRAQQVADMEAAIQKAKKRPSPAGTESTPATAGAE